MSVAFKAIALMFSLFAVCWTLVQFDKQQKTIGIGSSSMMQYKTTSGTRKLLSDNFSIISSSEDSSSSESPDQQPNEKQCKELHQLVNRKDQCSFVKTHSSCQMSEAYFQYLQFPYCSIPNAISIAFIVLGLWILYLIKITGMITEKNFCPSLIYIYKTLGISEDVAGVTFLAFGNGAAEILSTISVFTRNAKSCSSGLAFNSILGAGLFITTVVVGVTSFTGPFILNSRLFIRDILFYLGALAWVFLTFYRGKTTLYEALGYISLYLMFVATVVTSQYDYKRWKPMLCCRGNVLPAVDQERSSHHLTECSEDSDESEIEVIINSFSCSQNSVKICSTINGVDESTPLLDSSKLRSFTSLAKIWKGIKPWNDLEWKKAGCLGKFCIIINAPAIFCFNLTVPAVDFNQDDRMWNKWLNVFHCLVGPVFCVFVTGYGRYMVVNVLPLWAVMLIAGSILAFFVALSTTDSKLPSFHCAFAFMAFFVSLFWIYTSMNEVINLLRTIGVAFQLSDSILGLTFLAWGNGLPDLVANWIMARHGYHKMVVAACFGAPFQDMLLGFGLSFFIATVRGDHILQLEHDSNQYIISASFLAVSLASSGLIVPLMGFRMPRTYGIYLILLYIAYLVVSLSEEIEHF